MYKIILALCIVLAVAKGEVQEVAPYESPTYECRPDDYINFYRQHFRKVLQDYDIQLDQFIENYLGIIDGINVHIDLLTDNLVELKYSLNSLEILSEKRKRCVNEYRHTIPEDVYVVNEIGKCASQASGQVDALSNLTLYTRNALHDYYEDTFERGINQCAEIPRTEKSCLNCIDDVIKKASEYTIENQKEFEYRMEAAECAAKVNIKRCYDCSHNIEVTTTALVAAANYNIGNCISDKGECKPCKYSCIYNFALTEADHESKTVFNPFYHSKGHPECLMVKYPVMYKDV